MRTALARSRLALSWRDGGLAWAILAAVYAISVVISPDFLSWHTIRLQLIQAAFVGLIAVGQTLAILLGQIDLSVPWTITFTAVLASNLYAAHPSQLLAFVIVVCVGTVVGLVNTLGVYVLRVHSLIWTLSVNLILQGVTLIYTNAAAPTTVVPPVAQYLAVGVIGGIPVAALVWALAALAVIVALRATPFGRAVYATGSNELAALLSGVGRGRTVAGVFVISGLCAAFVGLLLAGYSQQAYLGMGNDYMLPPIAAVVIGGTRLAGGEGGYAGSIAGALTVVLLEAVLVTLNVSQGARDVVFGAILLLLAFVFLRRAGR